MAAYEDYIEYLKHVKSTTEQDIRSQIDRLNGTIATLKDTVSSLNKAKDSMASDLVKARRDSASKTDELNLKEQEFKKISAEVNVKSNEIKDLSKKLNEVKESLSEVSQQNIALKERLSKEQEKTKSLSNEVASVREQLSNLNLSVSNENKKLSDKLNNSLSNLRDLQAKLDSAEMLKNSLLQKCSQLENELANLKRQGISSDSKMQAELTELSNKLSSTLKTLANTQSRLDEVNLQKSQIQQKCVSLEQELSKAKSKSHSNDTETKEISDKLSDTLKSLAATQSKLDEANRQNFQIQQKCASLEQELLKVKSKSLSNDAETKELSSKLSNALKSLAATQSELDEVNLQKSQLERDCLSLENKLDIEEGHWAMMSIKNEKSLQDEQKKHKKYVRISIVIYAILIMLGFFAF